jgi:hypothetical protein
MGFRKIERFLNLISSTTPDKNVSFLEYCAEVWSANFENEEFTVFFSLLAEAIRVAPLLDINKRSLLNLKRTLLEIHEEFFTAKLTVLAPKIWEQNRRIYPLLARAIDEVIHPFDVAGENEPELVTIEAEVKRIKTSATNLSELDPASKAAISEITELLEAATKKIREEGLAHFSIDRIFLFGRINLVFNDIKTEFAEVRGDITALAKRLLEFGITAGRVSETFQKISSAIG